MPNANERDALIATERTPQDHALEHAGHLAEAAERFIAAVCVDAQAALDHDEQDVMETAKAADKAREDAGEYMTSLRAAIHDFRVHRNRALAATAPNAGTTMWAVRIQGPDDLFAAPDREIADAVALVLNRQFLRHPFPSEVKVHAEVVPWPHGYEAWSAQKDLLQLEVKGIES